MADTTIDGDPPDDLPRGDGPDGPPTDEQAPTDDAVTDEDYVYLPPESSRLRRALVVLLGLAVFVLLIGALGGWWVLRQVDPGSPGAEISVTVPAGSTTSQIATLLEERGVITNATVFQYYAKWKNAGPFKAGEYGGLRRNSSMGDVVKILKAGPLPPKYTEVRVHEGAWLAEIRAQVLQAFPQMSPAELDDALLTVRSRFEPNGSNNLEGLLFPATYRVDEGSEIDEQKLVQQMVQKFDEVGGEIGLDQASDKLAGVAGDRTITPYDVVIVASMVEAEAKVPEDRAKIARVIYNRLASGESLGIDATVIYALGARTDKLTASDLKIDSPFNTRVKVGLPPAPIGSPSKESLIAALNPADGDWTYYVLADENGAHYFTNDYQDFLRAQREARDKGLL